MRLIIAGKDRSSDIGADLVRRSTRHAGPLSPWSPQDSALSLKDSSDASDYTERFWKLMRLRWAVSTDAFPIPARPGLWGGMLRQIKAVLWKVFRYQHDRIAFQQNTINELVVNSVGLQQSDFRRKIIELEKKLERMESDIAALRHNPAKGEDDP